MSMRVTGSSSASKIAVEPSCCDCRHSAGHRAINDSRLPLSIYLIIGALQCDLTITRTILKNISSNKLCSRADGVQRRDIDHVASMKPLKSATPTI